MRQWSDVHFLAGSLVKVAGSDKKKHELRKELFKTYHVALFTEKVITRQGKINKDFLNNKNIDKDSTIERFRIVLSYLTFVHYLEKLTFCEDKGKKENIGQKQLNDFKSTVRLPIYSDKMELNFNEIFGEYCQELAEKIVVDSKDAKRNRITFTDDFIQGGNLTPDVATFRSTLLEAVFIHFWRNVTFKLSAKFGKRKSGVTYKSLDDSVEDDDIKSFLNKFIFAVHTPNEVQLGKILTKEVDAHYNLFESDFQSSYILEKMLNWFKKKNSEWY